MALFFFPSHYLPGVFYELVCINLTLSINRSLKDQKGVIFLVGGGGSQAVEVGVFSCNS